MALRQVQASVSEGCGMIYRDYSGPRPRNYHYDDVVRKEMDHVSFPPPPRRCVKCGQMIERPNSRSQKRHTWPPCPKGVK